MKNAVQLLTVLSVLALAGCRENSDSPANPPDDQPVLSSAGQQPEQIPSPQSKGEVERADDDADAPYRRQSESEHPTELPSLADVAANPIDPKDDPYSGEENAEPVEEVQTIEIPATWKRLSPQQEIWVDMKNKQVIAAGHICLNAGALEMFICPRGTKEHESVIALNALSSQVHAALLAVGATPGHPVRWQDEYEAASGPVIQVMVMWQDEESNTTIERRGQELVRNIDTGKTMELDWVFGGSETGTNEETGETFYYGDSGELVCLSNFSTATMDVPVESTDAEQGLLFAANTPAIPELGTKVYVKFKPVLK